jgi:lambda family phage minor tail protein L
MAISPGAYLEKNKLASNEAWLVLLDITMPDTTQLFVVANSEDVIWPVTNGDTYIGFPFTLGEIGDTSKGEVPSVSLRISNVTRWFEPFLEAQEGLVDSVVVIRIVNSMHVTTPSRPSGENNATAEVELTYEIIATGADNMWVTFKLGAMNPWRSRFPRNRIWRNTCRYKKFKGTLCKYDGGQTTCDRTIETCRDLMLNSINFGGAPGVETKALFV